MASSKLEEGGAKAVEVAAMLGDSVVGVKHCMDPRAGKVTRATWAFAAGGLACLLASAAAFYVSIDTAARNKAALEYHTRVEHKPAYSFRPRVVGAPVSWLAFGGLAFGLAASGIALARSRAERRSPYYRIGTAPGVEQPVEGAPSESFALVAPSGDDFVFNYGAGIEGELILDGRSTPLSELAATGRARPSATAVGAVEIPIPPAAKIRARAGRTTFLVSAVGTPKRQTTPLLAMLEGRPAKYVAGSLVAHLAIVLVLSQVAVEDSGVTISPGSREQLSLPTKVNAHEEVPPEQTNTADGEDRSKSGQDPGMELPPGAVGDPSKLDPMRPAQVANLERQISREEAVEQARRAGFFESTLLRDRIAAMTSDRDFERGFDPDNFRVAFDDNGGAGPGTFGGSRSGDDRGGGCLSPPCGIIRADEYRTSSNAGDDFWKHRDRDRKPGRDHVPQPPSYSYPKEISGGTLDKSIIKRYITRSRDSIGFCYEKELLARPGIAGEVTIQFLINGSGGVQSSTGHGFDATVASCVAGVIKSISFPAPQDGSAVTVNYPFTFRAAGA